MQRKYTSKKNPIEKQKKTENGERQAKIKKMHTKLIYSMQVIVLHLGQCEWDESACRCGEGVHFLRHLSEHHRERQIEWNATVPIDYDNLYAQ